MKHQVVMFHSTDDTLSGELEARLDMLRYIEGTLKDAGQKFDEFKINVEI